MTEVEQALIAPLGALKGAGYAGLAKMALAGLNPRGGVEGEAARLERLGLERPATLSDRVMRILMRGAIRAGG